MRIINEKIERAFLAREKKSAPKRDYVNGYYMEHGATISTDGERLWSYNTPIAKWDGGRVIMDARRYSNTTSRQQSDLRQLARELGVELVEIMENVER